MNEELKEIEKELKMLEKVREELMEQLFQMLSKKKLKKKDFEYLKLWKRKKKWIDGKINYYRYLLPYLIKYRWSKEKEKEKEIKEGF